MALTLKRGAAKQRFVRLISVLISNTQLPLKANSSPSSYRQIDL